MDKISSKSEVFDFSGGQKPPIRGLTIIKRSCHYGNLPYLVANTYGLNFIKIGCIWIFSGDRNPLEEVLHVTCDAHLRTWPSYSSRKSYVKIWVGLVEPFKNYRVHKHFSGGQKPPIRGFAFDLWCSFSNSDELFQSKGRGGGVYMWPAMTIFEPRRSFLDKSHVWKFGLDWLGFSRVIVGRLQKKKKKNSIKK